MIGPSVPSKSCVTYGTLGFSPGCSMFQRSARMALAVELAVAGDAPDVGRDAVLLVEDLLRPEHFGQDRPAAEQLRAQLAPCRVGAAANRYRPFTMPRERRGRPAWRPSRSASFLTVR